MKLVFTEVGAAKRNSLDQELSLFIPFLLEQHPNVVGLVYQHSPTRAKPTKHDEYHLAFGLLSKASHSRLTLVDRANAGRSPNEDFRRHILGDQPQC